MLAIHILNVGHGDSIVIEYTDPEDNKAFGVIDSNRVKNKQPPALRKLQELNAEKLSFVALTHPHADHYKGLLDILEAYQGKVDSFYTFPLDHHKEGRLKALTNIYGELYKDTDGGIPRSNLAEYVKILAHAKNHIEDWQEHSGHLSLLTPSGFAGIDISVIMPPSLVKGIYFEMIRSGDFDAVEKEGLNVLSLAFLVAYRGKEVVLGGDATYKNWLKHKQLSARREEKLHADAAKLPHHGSQKECRPRIIEYIFGDNDKRFACISANGRSHPDSETLVELKRQNILPYCTNLAKDCGGQMNKVFPLDTQIDPKLLLYLNRVMDESLVDSQQPCQGDITITIDNDGALSVTPERDLPCPYRGGYDFVNM